MKIIQKNRTKITVVLLIILTFVLGAGLSASLLNNYYRGLFDKIEIRNPSFNIYETVKVLTLLRSKRYTQAINYEEWRLDDNLVNLANYMRDNKPDDPRAVKFAIHSIRAAKNYRLKHPCSLPKTLSTKNSIAYLFKSRSTPEN